MSNHSLAIQRDSKHEPKFAAWKVEIIQGGLGAGAGRRIAPDTTKVFMGDTVIVKASFTNMTKADQASIGWGTVSGGVHLDIPLPKAFESDNVLQWVVKPKKVGAEGALFQVTTATVPYDFFQNFLVVVDLQDFTLGCIEAQSTLSGKFDKATRKLNEAATAYLQAYNDQEQVLSSLAASEKMMDDIAFGVLFAAVGGYAGGALATELKAFKTIGEDGKPQAMLSDAIIDSAKDTAKFVVRSFDRLRGGSSSPSSSGDSTSPTVEDPIRTGGGKYKPAGEHPQEFLTKVASRVASEGEIAQGLLTKLIHEAKEARRATSKADFDEDPVAVVNKGQTLDMIGKGLVTEKKIYLAALWKAWLQTHGWQTMRVLEAIRKAAEGVGEDYKTWIPYVQPAEMKRRPGQGPIRPL